MSSSKDNGRDYDVGWGKPPKATQFPKGQSGNPRGRKPGRQNLKTELLRELNQTVAMTVDGRRRKMSLQTVITKRLVADAAKGDAKARDQLLRLINQIEATPEARGPDPFAAAKDAEILARFRDELVNEIKETEK